MMRKLPQKPASCSSTARLPKKEKFGGQVKLSKMAHVQEFNSRRLTGYAPFATLPIPFFGIPYNGTRLWEFLKAGGRETFLAFLLFGCNQPFDPRGELDQKPVVFSVLSTDRNVQFVRVERSYMPAGYDALADTSDKSIRNAIVTISDGGATLRLRDTTLCRNDTSRLKLPIRAYVVSPFRPIYGGSYNIRVEANGFGQASELVLIPTKPLLDVDAGSTAVVDQPGSHQKGEVVLFSITLGDAAYGFIGRMFIDYDVLKDGQWEEGRVEIPMSFAIPGSGDFSYVIYPQLRHKTLNNHAVGIYMNDVYTRALIEVAYTKYGSTKIVFNRAVFRLLQVDRNLYSYYMTTHSYSDPHSTRLDEPNFSGVVGGVGLIGSYTLDSLVHLLPENFAFDRY